MSNYTKNETSVVQTFYKGLLSRRGNINHLGALKWVCGVKATFPIRKRSVTVLKINCHKQTYYDVYSLYLSLLQEIWNNSSWKCNSSEKGV